MSDDIVKRLREWNRQYEGKMPNDIVAATDLIEALRQQLSNHIKREVMLRDALDIAYDHLLVHWTEDHIKTVAPLNKIPEALAATADLKDVRLCEKEPAAWQTFDGEGGYDYRSYEDNEDYRDDYIKRNSSQKFYENWVIPLYRAWEPKP